MTSGLKDLSNWNLVQVSFLAWEVQKSHLDTQKQTSVQLFHILSSRYAWPEVGPERYVALQLFKKFFFPQKLKTLI